VKRRSRRKADLETRRIIRRIQHPEEDDLEIFRKVDQRLKLEMARKILAAAGIAPDQVLRAMPSIVNIDELKQFAEDLVKSKEELKERIRPLNYAEWSKVIESNFSQAVFEAEALASAAAILRIKDVANPFGLILVGPPSSMKTTLLNLFAESNLSYKTDFFTPSSFVSHHAKYSEERLEEIDLVPRIKDKIFVVPDLGCVFGMKQEDLLRNISIMTRLFDGQGLFLDSAVHGRRGYPGPVMFIMLSGTTPIPHRVWNVMGTLGARLFFLQMRGKERKKEEYVEQLKGEAYSEKLAACGNATRRFLTHLFSIQYPESIEWNREKDPKEVLEVIVRLAQLLARLRGIISVAAYSYETETGEKRETAHHSYPIIELPDRAALMLYNLGRGHALTQGRTQIANQDLPLLIEVALSSAPQDRVQAFELLLRDNKPITAHQLEKELNYSRDSAYRTMKTLDILQLATLSQMQEKGVTENFITIKPDLEWFQSEEFKKLRLQKPLKLEDYAE